MSDKTSSLSSLDRPGGAGVAHTCPAPPGAAPRIEVVSPPSGSVLRHYRCTPLGDKDRALTLMEQAFISSFVDPSRSESMLDRAAEEFGVAGQQLRVEFTFDNGHKGGLLFRRL